MLTVKLQRLRQVAVGNSEVQIRFVAALSAEGSTTVFALASADSPDTKERSVRNCRFDFAGERLQSEYFGALGPGKTLVSFEIKGFEFVPGNRNLKVRSNLGEVDLEARN